MTNFIHNSIHNNRQEMKFEWMECSSEVFLIRPANLFEFHFHATKKEKYFRNLLISRTVWFRVKHLHATSIINQSAFPGEAIRCLATMCWFLHSLLMYSAYLKFFPLLLLVRILSHLLRAVCVMTFDRININGFWGWGWASPIVLRHKITSHWRLGASTEIFIKQCQGICTQVSELSWRLSVRSASPEKITFCRWFSAPKVRRISGFRNQRENWMQVEWKQLIFQLSIRVLLSRATLGRTWTNREENHLIICHGAMDLFAPGDYAGKGFHEWTDVSPVVLAWNICRNDIKPKRELCNRRQREEEKKLLIMNIIKELWNRKFHVLDGQQKFFTRSMEVLIIWIGFCSPKRIVLLLRRRRRDLCDFSQQTACVPLRNSFLKLPNVGTAPRFIKLINFEIVCNSVDFALMILFSLPLFSFFFRVTNATRSAPTSHNRFYDSFPLFDSLKRR